MKGSARRLAHETASGRRCYGIQSSLRLIVTGARDKTIRMDKATAMAILPVLRLGNPLLLDESEPVATFDSEELHSLVTDMIDTMRDLNGAGLAAPQIGAQKRVVVFGFEENPRYPDADSVPFTVLINPEITPVGDEMEEDWEGCLSVPGMRGLVPRYVSIRYAGYDVQGNRIERTARGFHARVVQHEVDHLDGVLYPQRITDMTQFGFEEELDAALDNDGDDDD